MVTLCLESASLVEDGLAHERGHAGGAVDAQEIGAQVHAGVTRAEIHLKTQRELNKTLNEKDPFLLTNNIEHN